MKSERIERYNSSCSSNSSSSSECECEKSEFEWKLRGMGGRTNHIANYVISVAFVNFFSLING